MSVTVLVGDFHYEEVQWEGCSMEAGEELWSSRILNNAVENIMTQCIEVFKLLQVKNQEMNSTKETDSTRGNLFGGA